MPTAIDSLDAAIQEAARARTMVARFRSGQVRNSDTLASLKSTAYAWFKTHRPIIEGSF